MKKLRTFIIIMSSLGLAALLIASGFYLYLKFLVSSLESKYPIYNAEKKKYELVKKKPTYWVKVSEVSNEAVWAIILSEDWAFYQHKGLDYNQLKIVIDESIKEKRLVRGASTITQQVVKNALLSNERSLIRKAKEMVLALMIEEKFPKKKILELYLNLIELGDGIYGVKNASRFYFDKNVSKLNAKEGAFLAMLLPSPVKYATSFRKKALTPFAKEQIDNILKKLLQAKIINDSDYNTYLNSPLDFEEKYVEEYDDDLLSIENESY